MSYAIPIRLWSTMNMREHWARRAKRSAQHRAAAIIIPKSACILPAVVTITRVAPKPLDTDNLAASAKGLRDGIADRFGVKDNDPRIEWRYAQRRGGVREYLAEVDIHGVESVSDKGD